MLINKETHRYILGIFFISILWSCNQVDTAISDALPSCFDGIKNQGEFDIDCGGPCINCTSKMSANVNGMNWESMGSVTTQVNNNSIFISGGNAASNLSLIYTGPFVNGTFNLNGGLYTENATSKNYTANTGTITFVQWDNENDLVYGTFKFTAFESTGTGDSVIVKNGVFSFVAY